MATLTDNVARAPARTLNSFVASPGLLRDETPSTVKDVAMIWAREGLREKMKQLAESAGVTPATKATLLRACSFNRIVH